MGKLEVICGPMFSGKSEELLRRLKRAQIAKPNTVEILVKNGKRVIVAGLDMDSNGIPFDPMPQLLAKAESVLKVVAVCEVCGADATHTYRHVDSAKDTVLVGASDHYEARCRNHWQNDY